MLAVLSEINCLDQLQSMKIYPDFFSTDLEEFKNYAVTFNDCTIVCILAGVNRFYRKAFIELVKSYIKIAESDNNTTVSDVIVITDTTITGIGLYYKLTDNLYHLNAYSDWNLVSENSDVLTTLKSEIKKPVVKLSNYDRGIFNKNMNLGGKRKSSEDDLIPLIVIPNLNIVKK